MHRQGPCGREVTGKSAVDRRKLGTKRSLLVDGSGIPVGCVIAGANLHNSPLLRPTLDKLNRFGFYLPEQITIHLDAGYDSKNTRRLLSELGCDWVISKKGEPLQAGARWVVERTNSWHNRGFRKLFICTSALCPGRGGIYCPLANAVIIIRRLILQAWITHHRATRPARRP